MKRKCAWCGVELGVAFFSSAEEGVTHGICLECREQMIAAFRLANMRENVIPENGISCSDIEKLPA